MYFVFKRYKDDKLNHIGAIKSLLTRNELQNRLFPYESVNKHKWRYEIVFQSELWEDSRQFIHQERINHPTEC